jgi:hypothetical protein
VLQSGMKWGTFTSRSRSGVAGLLPPGHSGPKNFPAARCKGTPDMAFRGHFDYSLDAKNRLNVPAKFPDGWAGGTPNGSRCASCAGR